MTSENLTVVFPPVLLHLAHLVSSNNRKDLEDKFVIRRNKEGLFLTATNGITLVSFQIDCRPTDNIDDLWHYVIICPPNIAKECSLKKTVEASITLNDLEAKPELALRTRSHFKSAPSRTSYYHLLGKKFSSDALENYYAYDYSFPKYWSSPYVHASISQQTEPTNVVPMMANNLLVHCRLLESITTYNKRISNRTGISYCELGLGKSVMYTYGSVLHGKDLIAPHSEKHTPFIAITMQASPYNQDTLSIPSEWSSSRWLSQALAPDEI